MTMLVGEKAGITPTEPVDALEAHCAFCAHPLPSGRRTKRFCNNRCRAAESTRRKIYEAVRASLARMFNDPTLADNLPIEIVPALIEATDRFRGWLAARLSHHTQGGTMP